MLYCLQTQKGPELVFRPQFSVKIFDEIFSFVIWHKLANLIKILYLLLKLISEMYFLFYVSVFDDVMKFENVEF